MTTPVADDARAVALALVRGLVAGLLGLVVYAIVPIPTGPPRLVDALIFAGGVLGFNVVVIAAAVRLLLTVVRRRRQD